MIVLNPVACVKETEMPLSRRRFFASIAAVAAAIGGGVAALMMGGPPRRALSAVEKNTCALTVAAAEGPYHVTGMAELADGNLNASGLEGPAIEVSGHVYDGASGETPLAGAEVEIWHADSSGNYRPNGNGPATKYQPSEIALRGFVKTDAAGAYRFTTIYPGEYTGRVRHFHFKVRAAGKPELTTQLIVPPRPGDKLTFDTDDIAEGLPNCQLLAVDESAVPAKARFDFRV
jgi:protocatechuate 3,4-dioxygenase beta subunit